MSVYGQLGALNSGWFWKASITGAGAQNTALEVGKTYRIQAVGADVYVGFGSTAAAADTAGGSTKGERVFGDTAPMVITINSASIAYLSRTPVSGTTELRVQECVTV